jgi:hypothetical protein
VRMGRSVDRLRAVYYAKAGPEGRRILAYFPANNQNKLYDTVTRLQRVCGQPFRGPRRQVFVAGVEPCRGLRRGRSTADE